MTSPFLGGIDCARAVSQKSVSPGMISQYNVVHSKHFSQEIFLEAEVDFHIVEEIDRKNNYKNFIEVTIKLVNY